MAAPTSFDGPKLEGDIEQWRILIQCSVCMATFNRPLQLTCGHTYCSSCIGEMADRSIVLSNAGSVITCPDCRTETLIPNEGLNVNYRMQEMVEKLSPLIRARDMESSVEKCISCPLRFEHGISFNCDTCQKQLICSFCCVRHHNGHTLFEVKAVTLNDVTRCKDKLAEHEDVASEALNSIKRKVFKISEDLVVEFLPKMYFYFNNMKKIRESLDTNVPGSMTRADLEKRVNTAVTLKSVFTEAADNIDSELCGAIRQLGEKFLLPFEEVRNELGLPAPPRPPTVEQRIRMRDRVANELYPPEIQPVNEEQMFPGQMYQRLLNPPTQRPEQPQPRLQFDNSPVQSPPPAPGQTSLNAPALQLLATLAARTRSTQSPERPRSSRARVEEPSSDVRVIPLSWVKRPRMGPSDSDRRT